MQLNYPLIRQLADGRFYSGESLAEKFGVSRAAVWKQLRKLGEQLGLDIQAVPGRGYRLAEPLELLDETEIRSRLNASQQKPAALTLQDRVDSTNSWLMRQASSGAPSGSICLAEHQTAGRGRRGRSWASPFGNNIYLSILWRFPRGPAELSGLSLAAGLAVLDTLRRQGIQGPGLKWPNDLLWNGRKLAGLLLELVGESDGPSAVVLGVGLNLRLSSEQAQGIDQPWVDLKRLPGAPQLSRNLLAADLIKTLLGMLRSFERAGFAPLTEQWNRNDLFYGQPVVLRSGAWEERGIHRGVDPRGALLLENGDTLRAHHAGELSLRQG